MSSDACLQALVALRKCGKLGYVVSQNVDNLHLQSGIDAAGLAELHGNCFIEQCHSCRAKYRRAFEIETVCHMALWMVTQYPP